MTRPPVRVTSALRGLLGAGLVVQAAIFLSWVRPVPVAAVGVAALVTALAFVAGAALLRRAFAPLSSQSAQLQSAARATKVAALPAPPASPSPFAASAPAAGPARSDLAQLRRRLRGRLQDGEQLREQAAQASAYKTGFLRSVRHELRTPLNAILGFSEVLLSDLEGPLTASQRENLVIIHRTGRRLQDLFDEVIELATVVSGQLELQREAVDAGTLFEEVREELEEERGDRPVHIRVDAVEGMAAVAGDPFRLKQLVRGMASHALSVTTGPLLVLTVSSNGNANGVRLAVRDPSRRLSQVELSGLLSQGAYASRRRGLDEGSRLRIAIWQQLAHLYGGEFVLDSDERGTTYALDVPSWGQS